MRVVEVDEDGARAADFRFLAIRSDRLSYGSAARVRGVVASSAALLAKCAALLAKCGAFVSAACAPQWAKEASSCVGNQASVQPSDSAQYRR